MRQSRKFSGPGCFVYCSCRIFAPSAIMIVFSEDDLPFGGARLKEKRPAPKAFGSTCSSDVASEQRFAQAVPPVARSKKTCIVHR